TDSTMNAAPVRNLSAIGSAILPKLVTRPRDRAMSPSSLSVYMATANTAKAAQRRPGDSSPAWPPASRNQTKNGTSRIRTVVRTFGRFQFSLIRPVYGPSAAGELPGVLGPLVLVVPVLGRGSSGQV